MFQKQLQRAIKSQWFYLVMSQRENFDAFILNMDGFPRKIIACLLSDLGS